jgi:hypothetical protein
MIDSFPEQVNVSQGIIYLAGHRFTAPLTIGYCGQEFCVNGLVAEQDLQPRYPVHPPTKDDTLRFRLDQRALEIARDGKRRGLPHDRVLLRILDLYRASPLVSSAAQEDSEIAIFYVGSRGRFVKAFPRNVALEDPSPELIALRGARIRYNTLVEMQSDLSTGHLIVHSGRDYAILPSEVSLELDAIIQKMLSGTPLGEEEERVLDSYLPEFIRKGLSTPKPLQGVRSDR